MSDLALHILSYWIIMEREDTLFNSKESDHFINKLSKSFASFSV